MQLLCKHIKLCLDCDRATFFTPYVCIGCPTTYQTRHFFNNSKTNQDIATKQTHTTDTFLFISHTTNVLLFKFRFNIFIGFRIIKEMPGLVGSGTSCIIKTQWGYLAKKKNTQWRRVITTKERLTLTLRLVHIPYIICSPSSSEPVTPKKAAAFWLTTFVKVRLVAGRSRTSASRPQAVE